jgi:hypothetical protein
VPANGCVPSTVQDTLSNTRSKNWPVVAGVGQRCEQLLAVCCYGAIGHFDLLSLGEAMFELQKLRPFRCSESAVLPSGRESVGAVSVFEFVVGGLADQALPFLPRREMIASRIQ